VQNDETCPECGEDFDDCDCEVPEGVFDPDELGLDPEDDVEFLRRRRGRKS